MSQPVNPMRFIISLFAGLALIGLVIAVGGAPVLAQKKAYRIGVRDILAFQVYAGGHLEHEVDLTVGPEGTVKVPFLGAVHAEGLTVDELERNIKEPLARDFFVDPLVNIQIKAYHSLHYFISGAVKNPGSFETPYDITLLELIAKAGGVLTGRGNVAYVLRESDGGAKVPAVNPEAAAHNRNSLRVDLTRLLDKGDMGADMMLKPGDVVYIPLQTSLNQTESKIYVEGRVKVPGVYDFQPGLTALNACIMAGGFDEFAAPNRATVFRKKGDAQEVIKVDLEDVRKGKDEDVQLLPGDRIHIPESWF